MEGQMTGILNTFGVEHGVRGAKVLARSRDLTADCISDAEIESNIEMLKDDVDACRREMKRLVRPNRSGSLF
jgi:hypothetical protein